MTRQQVLMLAGAVVLCATAGARGDVVGIFWEGSNTEWDVFAALTADTVLLTGDMGDVGLNEPPDGVNNGLYSSMGQIIAQESFMTFGGVPPIPIRLLTITPSGTGSLADAAGFVIGGVLAQPHPNDFSFYALQLGHFVVDSDTFIGGLGGPNLDVQSRIHLGWTDVDGVAESGVFNIPRIPGPASVGLLALGLVGHSRRRRHR